MKYICPVCGYTGLSEPAYYNGSSSDEFCECCGFQFGWTDDDLGYTFADWRKKWVDGGMKWSITTIKSPPNWNPRKQLADFLASGKAKLGRYL